MLSKLAKTLTVVLLLFFTAERAHSQAKFPAETRNAALRYWLAFAELQDPPSDKQTADLLEKTAAGEAAWDEAKLGPILDRNESAIRIMQRATKLPECDWGLEYALGPRASIAYVPRARVLARLNTLYGMRLLAKGDPQGAVDTWLAGIRFSRHVAAGGSLIFTLVGKMSMVSNLRALAHAAQNHDLTGAQRREVEITLQTIPKTGFNWGLSLRYEEAALDVGVKQLSAAKSPAAYYREMVGEPAPVNFVIPGVADIAAFHKLMSAAEDALNLPPDVAERKLEELQQTVKTLHPFFQNTVPSLTRINASRIEVQTAINELANQLQAK